MHFTLRSHTTFSTSSVVDNLFRNGSLISPTLFMFRFGLKKKCRITLYSFQSVRAKLSFHNRDVSSNCRIAGNMKSNNTEHFGAEDRDKILIFALHRGQFSVLRLDLGRLRTVSRVLSPSRQKINKIK